MNMSKYSKGMLVGYAVRLVEGEEALACWRGFHPLQIYKPQADGH
jgi:hypothetical protein